MFLYVHRESDSITIQEDQKLDLVEMLESVTYLMCGDDPIEPAMFSKVCVRKSNVINSIRSFQDLVK